MGLTDILGGATVVLLLTQGATGLILSERNTKIEMLEGTLALANQNTEVLKKKITKQNKALSELEADYNASVERWNNREPSTVYVDKWHTKFVDRNITTEGNCNDVLEAIHNHGY